MDLADGVTEWLEQVVEVRQEVPAEKGPIVVLELDDIDGAGSEGPAKALEDVEVVALDIDLQVVDVVDAALLEVVVTAEDIDFDRFARAPAWRVATSEFSAELRASR